MDIGNDEKKKKHREYMATFIKKNADKYLLRDYTCDLCGGTYKYVNKSHHNKSQRHQAVENYRKRYIIYEPCVDDAVIQ